MGEMERNSGPTLIAYEWGHAAFIGNARAGICACHPTPHPRCSCVEQERACRLPGGSQDFWAIWLCSGLQSVCELSLFLVGT